MSTHKLPNSTAQIVDILNDFRLHAGTELAESVGVSRTAVWKAVQRLKKYGIEINSQHQGYSLSEPLVLLNQKKIQDLLGDFSCPVEVFESLPSTSGYLKKSLSPQRTIVCLAEHQSQGRGRLGRQWSSPFGRNIYCSFTYTFSQDASELSGLSLGVGIAIAKALESLSQDLAPSLKWPNDIYLEGKKAGGVLIELTAEAHGNCAAIISFGLNVNMKGKELEGLKRVWTSLEHGIGKNLDRNFVVAQVLRFIFKGLTLFQENGLAPFLNEWKTYDFLEGREISLDMGKERVTGIAQGISSEGSLLIKLPSGELRQFSYGDATLTRI